MPLRQKRRMFTTSRTGPGSSPSSITRPRTRRRVIPGDAYPRGESDADWKTGLLSLLRATRQRLWEVRRGDPRKAVAEAEAEDECSLDAARSSSFRRGSGRHHHAGVGAAGADRKKHESGAKHLFPRRRLRGILILPFYHSASDITSGESAHVRKPDLARHLRPLRPHAHEVVATAAVLKEAPPSTPGPP